MENMTETESEQDYSNARLDKRTEKFVVRLPIGMRSQIQVVSHANHRSMNSEIVARLEHSLASFESISISDIKSSKEELSNSADASVIQIEADLIQRISKLSPAKKKALLELIDE